MTDNSHQEFLDKYEPIHEPFVRYCSSKTFGWLPTEDLVQDTILATLEGYDRLENEEKLLGYMMGIANNILKNQRRQLKFKGEWDEKILQTLESRDLDAETATDIHYLLKAIDQLNEKQREAIILFEINGFSIKEISKIQDSSESATKTRLSRGRQELKKLLIGEEARLPLAKRLAIYASLF